MSLTKCIRKAGKNLSETDASYLKQVRQELIDSGSSAKDAEIGAVKTLIDEWQDSHNALAERINAQGGNVAANEGSNESQGSNGTTKTEQSGSVETATDTKEGTEQNTENAEPLTTKGTKLADKAAQQSPENADLMKLFTGEITEEEYAAANPGYESTPGTPVDKKQVARAKTKDIDLAVIDKRIAEYESSLDAIENKDPIKRNGGAVTMSDDSTVSIDTINRKNRRKTISGLNTTISDLKKIRGRIESLETSADELVENTKNMGSAVSLKHDLWLYKGYEFPKNSPTFKTAKSAESVARLKKRRGEIGSYKVVSVDDGFAIAPDYRDQASDQATSSDPEVSEVSIDTFNVWKDTEHTKVSGWMLFNDNGRISLLRKFKEKNAAGGGYVRAEMATGFNSVEDAKKWAAGTTKTAKKEPSETATDTKEGTEQQQVERDRKTYGWSRIALARNYTAKELDEWISEIESDPDNLRAKADVPKFGSRFTKDTDKKLDALGWAVTNRLKMDKAEAEKPEQGEVKKKTKPLSKVIESAGKEPEGGFNESDKVPDTTPKTYVEQYDELWTRANKADESLTLKEVIAYVKSLQANEDAVKADLNKLTKAKLANYYSGYHFNDLKKAQLVNSVYKDLAGQFGFLTTNEEMMVIGGTGLKDRIAHTLDKLEAITEEQFRENLEARKAKNDARKAEYEKKVEGIKDPKTLEDFINAHRSGGAKNFTPEQWATYDRLHADQRLEKQQAARVKTVESVDGDVNYSLHEATHTQKGHDLFIVALADRVGSEMYRELNTKAKQLGGYYSRYNKDGAIAGFQFKSEEARRDFLSVLEGDSVEKTKEYTDKTDTLMDLAERMEERATASLNQDRKTNTHKRSTEAGYAIEKAENELGEAADIRALAEAIENGEAKYLSKLSARTEIEALRGEWNSLIWQARQTDEGKALTQERKDRSGYEWKKGVTPEQKVRFAEYPLMRVNTETVQRIAKDMQATKGFKQAGDKLSRDADKTKDRKMFVAGSRHFDKFKEFAIKNLQYSYMTDVAKDFNRMQKLGLETLPMLRAALLEFNEISSGATKKEVKSATSEKLKYSSFMGKFKDNDFFNTTDAPANQVVELADIEEGMTVFEPSAGLGHLADKAAEIVGTENVTTNELSFEMNKFLEEKGFKGTHGDFLELGTPNNLSEMKELAADIVKSTEKLDKLNTQQAKRVKEGSTRARSTTYSANVSNEAKFRDAKKATLQDLVRSAIEQGEFVPKEIVGLVDPNYDKDGNYAPVKSGIKQYDRVIMNPPFSKDQEITHIEHAYKFLKPGGRLVAITSSMAGERSNKRNKAFTEWLDELGADQYPLPEGSFKDAINPTGVNTKIIVIDKPEGSALFSKSAKLKDGATPKGLGVKHAENIAKAFLKTYKGADDGLKVRVYPSQAVAFGPDSRKRDGLVKGAFIPETNEVVLIAPHLDNTKDAIETLQHELIVHKGLGLFDTDTQDRIISSILENAPKSKSLKPIWEKVQKDYADKSEQVQAEEVIAKIAEKKLSKLDQFFNKIVLAIRNALRKVGLIKNSGLTTRDLLNLVYDMGEGFKQGREAGKRNVETEETLYSRESEPTQDEAALEKLGLAPKQAKTLGDKIRALKEMPFKEALSEKWERAYEGMFDGLYGLKKAEAAVGATDIESSGYVGARLASGVADTMHAVLHYGAPVWRDGILQHKEGTQGLLEIFGELNGELNGWLAWMGANRAEELMAQGRENNLTQQDINALKAQAFGREELFEEVRQKYIALNKAMLDMSEEAGLLQSGTRAKWESDYYVPFYRQEDGDADSPILAPRTKRGLSHQAAGIKALKGGDMATNDLLENVLQNWIKLTDSSMKNSALLKAVDNLKGSEYLTDESMRYTKALIPKGSLAKMMREDRKYKEMVADYLGEARDTKIDKLINKVAKLDNEGYESMWAVTAPTDPDIIRVQRNGKNEYYRVNDPSLLRAMVHIDAKGADNLAMRSGRYMKKLLTVGVTSSPDFILRNFIRDAVHAWSINPDEFKFGADSWTGLKHAVKEDEDYRALMFSGASFQGGYVHGTDPDKSAEIVRRALERKGLNKIESQAYMDTMIQTPHKLKNAMLQGWQAYRNAGDKVENSNRLGTYKAAIEAGKSRAQAAFESKDLMDYSLRGNFQLMMTFTDLIPFLNARMQGLNKLGRAAKENPRKVIMSTGIKIAMFSTALAMMNDDDERYQELPDWDKDANWHFWLGDDHYRIPKPFEIGIVFGTMPERIYHTMAGNQENEKLWWSLKHNILHTLNVNPTPQAVMPIVEVVANRSFFFDTPIEGMSDEGKLDEARYNERTSSTMVELGKVGKWVGLSPKELQHLYNGYLGTMGSYGLMLADMATNKATSRSPRPEWKPEDYPVVKSFYKGSGPAKSTQYMTNVYDRMNEAEEIYRTVRAYRKEGKGEEAEKLFKSEKEKLRYRKALGLARQQLGSINKQMDRISRDEGMSAAAKRVKMDTLRARKNKIAKRFSELTDGAF